MPLPPELWDGVLRRLGAELPAFTLDAWLRPIAADSGAGELRLRCPTPFHRERVRERFLPRIARCVEAECGRRIPIHLEVSSAPAEPAAAATPTRSHPPSTPGSVGPAPEERHPTPPAATRPAAPRQADLPYTFASFVVGSCNALAREASLALAQDRQREVSPLFIAGGRGLGKSHLARAIVTEARRCGSARGLYESAESFTNAFTTSLRGGRMEDFKRRYRERCELLVVEDVQFLASKRSTQLELFHTLAHLVDAGVRVVLTADRLPRDISGLDARLSSRMSAGLVAQLEPPDASVRRNILRVRAAHGGVHLPDDCLDLLVESTSGSVRDLEGVLVQLVASSSLLKRPIDLELTRCALEKIAPPRARRLEPAQVIDVVAGFFGTSAAAMASPSRRRDVVRPRQLAMYLCSRYSDESTAAIARAFGRQHPSVTNAIRKLEREILERAPLRYQVEELTARLDRLAAGDR
jgi:chromosomal replication initiator protein